MISWKMPFGQGRQALRSSQVQIHPFRVHMPDTLGLLKSLGFECANHDPRVLCCAVLANLPNQKGIDLAQAGPYIL
jgi:hypothetical protein